MSSPQLRIPLVLLGAAISGCTGQIFDSPSPESRSPDTCDDCVALVDGGTATRDAMQVVEPEYDGPSAALPFEPCVPGDGLCRAGCSLANDDDCPAVCGDGVLSIDETCDPADPTMRCPTSCAPSGARCTTVRLEGDPATCDARCVSAPIESCASGDGCCPAGCTATEDGDCPIDCTRSETWPTDWVRFEDRVLTLTNARRAAGASCGGRWYAPAGPVRMEARLRQAARCHSVDMGETGVLSHYGSDGSEFWERMSRAGYTGYPVAENVAGGYTTPEELVAGWMSSTGHCENIMTARANEMGLGYAESSRTYELWATQLFGQR